MIFYILNGILLLVIVAMIIVYKNKFKQIDTHLQSLADNRIEMLKFIMHNQDNIKGISDDYNMLCKDLNERLFL